MRNVWTIMLGASACLAAESGPFAANPTTAWIRDAGSNSTDPNLTGYGVNCCKVAAASDGSVYVAAASGGDVMISKFAPDGTLVFRTYYGGSGTETVTGLGVDTAGNLHVSGVTDSVDLPLSGAFRAAPSGREGYLARLSGNGRTLLFATYLGGATDDKTAALAVDPNGGDYVILWQPDPYLAHVNAAGVLDASIPFPRGARPAALAADSIGAWAGGTADCANPFQAASCVASATTSKPAFLARISGAPARISASTMLTEPCAGGTAPCTMSVAAIAISPAGPVYALAANGFGRRSAITYTAYLYRLDAPGARLGSATVATYSDSTAGCFECYQVNGLVVDASGAPVISASLPAFSLQSYTPDLASITASYSLASTRRLWPRALALDPFGNLFTAGAAANPAIFSIGTSFFAAKVSGIASGLVAPVIRNPPANATLTSGAVSLDWDAIPGATGYMGILNGQSFAQTGRSVRYSLPPGSYTAAVRACIGGFRDTQCGPAAARSFTITAPSASPSPLTILSPAPGATVNTSTVSFAWQPRPSAAGYELTLERNGALELGFKTPAAGAVFTLRAGSYRVRLRSCGTMQSCQDPETTANFTVAFSGAPSTIPSVTVTANTNGRISVRWDPIPDADLYKVQVVQPTAGPGGGALTVAATQTNVTSADLTVPPGSAAVYVAACNGDACGPNSPPTPINVTQPSAAAILGTPLGGTTVDGPVVFFSWSKVPGVSTYQLYVQDFGRQGAALNVLTPNNFFAAALRPGTVYGALVVAGGTSGPTISFAVRGPEPAAPTIVWPQTNGSIQEGDIPLQWSTVNGATAYEYYIAGPGSSTPVARGAVQNPAGSDISSTVIKLPANNKQPVQYTALMRICPAGKTCQSGSEANWGPWSDRAGVGSFTFTVTPKP